MSLAFSLDRARHWAILAGTALLPASSRINLRYRLLARLQQNMARRADVYLIRHPKTGGTWLRTLLTHLYHQKYGVSHRRVFKSDELHIQNRALPRWMITNGYVSWERLVHDAFVADDPMLADKKVLFVARHPGDIVVSWYIQYTKRTKAFKRELVEAELDNPIDRDNITRSEFIRHPDLGLPWLIRYHNEWAKVLQGRENAMIIRYEDLRGQTADTLARITRFIGEDFTSGQIARAVDFGSFENMRELEKRNYFRNASLKLRNPDDPEMRKVRRAKVGGYRDDLDAEQIAWIDRRIAEELNPVFGYGGG